MASSSSSSNKQTALVVVASALAGAVVATGLLTLVQRRRKAQQQQKENIYETKRSLSEYLLFHYGSESELLTWPFGPREALSFPADLAKEAIAFMRARGDQASFSRALDIGCAVGRTSFELSQAFSEVVGIDYSHSFIAAAQTLAQGKELPYDRYDEGDISTPLVAKAPAGAVCDRVRFEQGDACTLRADLGSFDLVLAANLVCRLPDARPFLTRLAQLVRPGGVLMLATPFTWMEQFTAKDKWLGGYYNAQGEAVHSFDTLSTLLQTAGFELASVKEMQFFIREHNRKNQWSVSKASFWLRKQDVAATPVPAVPAVPAAK